MSLQHRIKDILDSWLKVQAAWLYLEPIFGSQDIRNQIPVEGKMFEEVDEHWYVDYCVVIPVLNTSMTICYCPTYTGERAKKIQFKQSFLFYSLFILLCSVFKLRLRIVVTVII
jgi:hypothetical protein